MHNVKQSKTNLRFLLTMLANTNIIESKINEE